jgi:hypothetical protein
MYQQVKFEVINPDFINEGETNIFGGIAIIGGDGETITNVICGCCGGVFEPTDVKILERYDDWMDLTEAIVGD